MPGSNQHRLAKRMRWAARTIGVIAAVFLVTMLIGAAIAGGVEPTDIAGNSLGLLGAVALAQPRSGDSSAPIRPR